MAIDTDQERYADAQGFAREVNLPLLGVARIPPIPAGASVTQLLTASAVDAVTPIVDNLVETRRSLSLHTLLLAGFPEDPECFALGLAVGREWSRRGLRIAVVDLDFWNPTIARPVDQSNEGLVDVLEYGCSFGRVAWEIVADRLWVVGPGSHPPDEDRISEHADWPRAARVFSGRVDVTLFVAPLLDRHAFTGKLSKRMDAALLVTSVERTTRGDLRDAFLELWGSDAPMIGCVGIEAERSVSRAATDVAAEDASAGAAEPAPRREGPAGAPGALAPAPPAPVAAAVEGGEDIGESGYDADGMVATLEREVRRGVTARPPRGGLGRPALWIGIAAVIAIAAAIFDLSRTSDLSPERGAVQAPQASGEEPIGATPEAPIRSELGGGLQGAPTDIGDAATRPPAATGGRAASGDAPPMTPGKATDATLPFRVHVASFRSEEKVQGIVTALKGKGLEAWYEPAGDLPGWYRVFVGRFRTSEEAGQYASWLLDRHLVDRAQSFPSTAR